MKRETPPGREKAFLVIEDGSAFGGFSFGAPIGDAVAGEVVFNTGMVGYPESFTDPSYRGQILALTYPLIGNYGVPARHASLPVRLGFAEGVPGGRLGGEAGGPAKFDQDLSGGYESDRIHLRGLVVSEYSEFHHHWNAERGLSDLLIDEGIAGIEGVDTRSLVKRLRERGTMAGCIARDSRDAGCVIRPVHVVSEVSIADVRKYEVAGAKRRVAVVDCGCKNTIIRSLIARGVGVIRVPWNYDVTSLDIGGVLFSNGPGDPMDCGATIETARKAIAAGIPAFGICLGNQMLALACGATTYKLRFGHRGQNQPCRQVGTKRCFITSQNHGYAVDESTLPDGLEPWFQNLNDGTNEGLRHRSKPIMSVQFHPEAMPGPVDTGFLFDEFVDMLTR